MSSFLFRSFVRHGIRPCHRMIYQQLHTGCAPRVVHIGFFNLAHLQQGTLRVPDLYVKLVFQLWTHRQMDESPNVKRKLAFQYKGRKGHLSGPSLYFSKKIRAIVATGALLKTPRPVGFCLSLCQFHVLQFSSKSPGPLRPRRNWCLCVFYLPPHILPQGLPRPVHSTGAFCLFVRH